MVGERREILGCDKGELHDRRGEEEDRIAQ